MDWLLPLIVVGVFGYCIWWAARPKPVFLIRIQDGQARVTMGQVHPDFLQEVKEICEATSARSGTIRGIRNGGRIVLEFCSNIPPKCQQRIRNVWAL